MRGSSQTDRRSEEAQLLEALESGDFAALHSLQVKSAVSPRPKPAQTFFSQLEELLVGPESLLPMKETQPVIEACKTRLSNFVIPQSSFKIGKMIESREQDSVFEGEYAKNRVFIRRIFVRVDPKQLIAALQELLILSRLRHDNVILLLGVALDEQLNLCVVTERYSQFSLNELIKNNDKLSFQTKLKITFQVARTLMYFHSLSPRILFRNVVPGSFRVDGEGNIKIVDFGSAREMNCLTEKSEIQKIDFSSNSTLEYLSPETLSRSSYLSESDVYSFGVLMFSIFTGREFSHKKGQSLVTSILIERYRPELDSTTLPAELKALIQSCWANENKKRPSFEEICERLNEAGLAGDRGASK